MNRSAIVRAPKRRWLAYIATFAGAVLGECAIAVPAHSADFYGHESYPAYQDQYEPYRYGPVSYYQGAGYRPNCSPCGCARCDCGPCGCTWRCGASVRPRGHIVERRVVEREYYERRFVGEQQQHRPYSYAEPQWPAYPLRPAYEESRSPFPYGYGGVRHLSRPGSYDYDGYGGYGE